MMLNCSIDARRNSRYIVQTYERAFEMLNVHLLCTYLLNIKMILKNLENIKGDFKPQHKKNQTRVFNK